MKRKTIKKEERELIYIQDRGICQICGKKLLYDEMTIDHIIPLGGGGTNNILNYQCACSSCNQFKQNFQPDDFYEKITEIYWYQLKKKCGTEFTEKMNRFLLEL